ncbi:ABC transporter substrate-binding protein [Psychromarinibacter sp. C21-152]|uniref:ABC transporter substrate-binding protein n=1 Tax=Psychromarinibacter sediminicola TaxID=3033385 RepID=A0AAE3NWN9_9RHOB|nr:ABC transporter substrate-binding protein [Psychromarinibacter sediminicola]MDF0603059.1 ABC transporter substrate-binding protein [Psychromarinibacter sediminicola]
MTRANANRACAALLAGTALIAGAAAAQEQGGTLRVGITQMGPTPDPVVTTFGVNWMTAMNVCEGLFVLDESWTPQPMLVEDYSYSEDGRALTLTLREGLGFHSGAPLTAADVVASLERFRTAAGIGASFAGVTESIEAVDDLTVRINLKTQTPIVPGLLAGGQAVIMSAGSIEGHSATDAVTGLDCTGPYVLTDYCPDQGVTMTRWDDYQPVDAPADGEAGHKHAYADEILFRLMPEASVRRDSLITGELDVAMSLPTDFYEQLESDPNTRAVTVANNQSLTAVFNTQQGVMSDVNLRRAVYHALEMEPIMLASVGNPEFYTIDGSWIPDPNSFWYTTAGIEEFGQPDPALVEKYLAASDYDGEPIRWLVATEQYQKHFLTAITASQQLAEYGINVEIIEQPIATYLQTRANPEAMDAFSSFLPTYVDPTSIAYLTPTYPGFWTAPKKMELMDRLATTIDPEERKAIFEEVHALAYDTFPFIKYGTESNMYGVREGVQNYATSAVGGDTFYNFAPPAE